MSQLEDEISDVLNKAIRGLGKSLSDVSQAAGVDEDRVQAVLDGEMDHSAIRKLATVLNLDADALIGLPTYWPDANELVGVRQLVMPFHAWTVNAWLLEIDGVSLLFDTGWQQTDILSQLNGVRPDAVFITHAHEDHVGGMESLQGMGAKIITESEALKAGEFQFGKIRIKVIDLSGHCVPTASYLITGFDKPLWVVGDAIFAGSMGGCKSTENFELAVENLRKAFAWIDSDSLILSGHGPLTSVMSEKTSNPYRNYFLSAKYLR